MSTADGHVNTGSAYESGEPKKVSRNYFDDLQIGTLLFRAGLGQGNRYKGRVEIEGVGDSHCELNMVCGPDFRGPGVMAQLTMMTNCREGVPESQQRLGLSLVRQSNNPDGSEGANVAILDLDSHMNADAMNLFVQTGSKTIRNEDGTYRETTEKVVLQISNDGTLEAFDMRDPKKRLRYDIAGELRRLGARSG